MEGSRSYAIVACFGAGHHSVYRRKARGSLHVAVERERERALGE